MFFLSRRELFSARRLAFRAECKWPRRKRAQLEGLVADEMVVSAVLALMAVADLRLHLAAGFGTTDASSKGGGATWAWASEHAVSHLYELNETRGEAVRLG
jgi:hypothetical protein